MGELQLDGLMREHEGPRADLEPELELHEAPSRHARDASIASTSPREPSPRLAHTLRRRPKHVAVLSALPAPASPSRRLDMSTIAMPRLEPSAGRGIPRLFDRDLEDPTVILQAPLAAALVSRTASGTVRRAGESIVALGTEPDRARAMEPVARRSAIGPAAAGEPKRPLLRRAWQARLIVPVAWLITLAAVSWLLRAIL
jgi:hypothetical protein